MQEISAIKNIDCFVFDMDGTLYLSDEVIAGSRELIDLLLRRGIRFYYFTNNTSHAPADYCEKLKRLGFPGVELSQIMTAGHVMLHYLHQCFGENPRIFLCGTPPLIEQFSASGIELLPPQTESCDAVVIGFDTTMNYEKANNACRLIANGAPFLATNVDRVCPLAGGAFLLDCGSMCRMIEHATGVEAKFTGKPYAETVEYILAAAGTEPARTAMVGDRLYTDLATAKNGGITGIAVLSGETDMAEIEASDIRPDFILESVMDIYNALK